MKYNYFLEYYKENKDKIKEKAKVNYANNKKARDEKAKDYRQSDGYKIIKKQCDKRIQNQRRLSSVQSDSMGILGTRYTKEEDLKILAYKDEEGLAYKEIAKLLNRSMKGVEYRYNKLNKENQ